VRWESDSGISTPLASILAAHVKALLDENDFAHSTQDRAVVAIPDHLDEYGQEALLQAFGSNRGQIFLLWRPVAAAMAWLDAAKPTNLGQDDFMLVIYLGPDGMEFTTFGLREKTHNGRPYVLPVPTRPPSPASARMGMGLRPVRRCCPPVPGGPRGLLADLHHLPRDMGRHCRSAMGCRGLAAPLVLVSRLAAMGPRSCPARDSAWLQIRAIKILRELLKGSCKLSPADRQGSGETWGAHLAAELTSTLASQAGRLRGAVLCGPLAPRQTPRWLNTDKLGLQPDPTPCSDTLWMACACDDPVAGGARLYGERLIAGLPTYLDTPPVWLCWPKGKGSWIGCP
jgi:hypothetical protein